MIKWLKKFVKNASADSESASDWNGFLSWSAEWHAAVLGFSHGARDPRRLSPDGLPQGDTEHERDARNEPAYYRGFFIAGTVAQLILGSGFVGAVLYLVNNGVLQ